MSEFLLKHPKGELTLPVRDGTENPSGIDVGNLLKETDHVALDHGFMNTAACESKVTFIDGDAGILRYRGYPIEDLAAKSTFLETSYLLIYGELPTEAELADFAGRLRLHTLLHE
jgi:citrate synthase